MALRTCKVSKEVLVAWHENFSASDIRVHYNVSLDGQSFRTDPGPIPGAGLFGTGADPMIACSHQGTGWIGSYYPLATPPYFWIATKSHGEPYLEPAVQVAESGANVDKGVLAAGPPPGGGDDFLRFTYKRYDGQHRLRGMNSPPSVPFAVGGIGQGLGGNEGAPNSSLVIRTSSISALVGNWVVAYYSPVGPPQPRATRFTGTQWVDSVNPVEARVPTQQETELITWFQANENQTLFPLGGPYVFNTPSIAADPRDERVMYMAFLGITQGSTGSNNIDLFIAKSEDGGADFSGSPEGANVLHLRDVEDLEDPQGAIQFLPAITVDSAGVVHVFYQLAWPGGTNGAMKFGTRVVSIAQFSTDPTAWPTVEVRDVTPGYEMGGLAQVETRNGRIFFGDYTMADSFDCELFYGFVSRHDVGPSVGTYVAHVNLCLPADSNRDGHLTSADPAQFSAMFVNGDSRADLNRNQQLESGDVNLFLESYSCACNPP